MELLVFGHAGAKVLVFPTREGRFFDYENWALVAAVAEKIEKGWIQLYCVDSVDSESFYNAAIPPRSRIERHRSYEAYILQEVVPLMRKQDGRSFLIAHGCSIGAFHAVNLSLRYPGLFGKVVALSGRYDLTRRIGPFADLFDGYYDQDIYFQTPVHFLPQLSDEAQLALLRTSEMILVVGEEDPFCGSNQQLSHQLWDKRIWNALEIWPGEAHRPRYWRQMIRQYL